MLMLAMNWRALLKLDTTLLLVMRDSLLMIMSASTCPAAIAQASAPAPHLLSHGENSLGCALSRPAPCQAYQTDRNVGAAKCTPMGS